MSNVEFTRFDRWLLKRLCRKLVTQGRHRERIIEYYRIMKEAAKKQFTEDNKVTLDDFMLECFKEAE
jgi:hypothetical protein